MCYYQILVETNEKVGKSKENKKIYELDRTDKKEILDDIIIPYFKKEEITVNGHFLNSSKIARIIVKTSKISSKEYVRINDRKDENSFIIGLPSSQPSWIIDTEYTKDITREMLKEAKEIISKSSEVVDKKKVEEVKIDNKKVFIVHGHDKELKLEVIEVVKKLGLDPIILDSSANKGKTVIEKIEDATNVGYGMVLYTPCDIGGKSKLELKPRARQNVILEHGYLMAKLGRENVMSLVRDEVEIPSDVSGLLHTKVDNGWPFKLVKELKALGYNVDANNLL